VLELDAGEAVAAAVPPARVDVSTGHPQVEAGSSPSRDGIDGLRIEFGRVRASCARPRRYRYHQPRRRR